MINKKHFYFLLLITFGLRFLSSWLVKDFKPTLWEYEVLTQNMLEHGEYAFDYREYGEYKAILAPGFSVLTYCVYSIFGTSHVIMLFIQYILMFAAVIAVYKISVELLENENYAFCAGLMVALHPGYIHYSSNMLHQLTLYLPLFYWTIFFLIRAFKTNSSKYFMLAGLAGGCAMLTRATIMPVVVVSFIIILILKRRELKVTLQKVALGGTFLAIVYSDKDLKNVENTRNRVEYYFTMSPCLPLYILSKQEDIEDITYLDADLYFFDSYMRVFDDIGDASIAIIPHNYVLEMLENGAEKNGIYNVGWITWKNNDAGKECLRWWRTKCIEWCYDRHEEGRFADQKYLDTWPDSFKDVRVLKNPGLNLAPWNVGNYSLENKEVIYVSGEKLIFYHFHGLKQINHHEFDCHLRTYYVRGQKSFLIENIYKPYIEDLIQQKTSPAASIRVKNSSLKDKLLLQVKKIQTRISGDVISVNLLSDKSSHCPKNLNK